MNRLNMLPNTSDPLVLVVTNLSNSTQSPTNVTLCTFSSNGSLISNNVTVNMDEHFCDIVSTQSGTRRTIDFIVYSALGDVVGTFRAFETTTSDRLVWNLEMPNVPQHK